MRGFFLEEPRLFSRKQISKNVFFSFVVLLIVGLLILLIFSCAKKTNNDELATRDKIIVVSFVLSDDSPGGVIFTLHDRKNKKITIFYDFGFDGVLDKVHYRNHEDDKFHEVKFGSLDWNIWQGRYFEIRAIATERKAAFV